MFGTMVISLPSMHTGGELVVSFSGKRQKCQSSSMEFKYPVFAWYADVFYEVCQRRISRCPYAC